jgi:hypothetical protein
MGGLGGRLLSGVLANHRENGIGVQVPDGILGGHIYFHLGDDSAFRAERFSGVAQ